MISYLVLLFAVHSILVYSRVASVITCPLNCTCTSQEAFCSNLSFISGRFPDYVVNVIINGSNLIKLEPNIFGKQLKNILIEKTPIKEISSYTFTNMPFLQSLIFKSVFIDRIKSRSFHNISSPAVIEFIECTIDVLEARAMSYLSGLEKISISLTNVENIDTHAFFNIIVREFLVNDTDITNMNTSSFCSISNVEYFLLIKVNIVSVKAGAFNNMESIKNVHIKNCTFMELHCNAIMKLREATPGNHDTFIFTDSELACNCMLTPMVDYVKNHKNAITDSVICIKNNYYKPLKSFVISESCDINEMCDSSEHSCKINLNASTVENGNLSPESIQIARTVMLFSVILQMLF